MNFKYKTGDKVWAKIKLLGFEQMTKGHPGIIRCIIEDESVYPYLVKHLDENDEEAYREDELTLMEEPNNILKKICD